MNENPEERVNKLIDLAKHEVSLAQDLHVRIKANKDSTKEEKANARALLVAATSLHVSAITYAGKVAEG